jgi:hypothetical protein
MFRELPTVRSLPSPWDRFLREVDGRLGQRTEIHCLGGFVLHVMFNLPRPTADVDFVGTSPASASAELERIAGRGTELARAHGLYLQFVAVCDFPDDYEDRLVDLAPSTLSNLRLRALAPEDLVLSKLTRNSPKDIFDVQFLAMEGFLNLDVLHARYRDHLRPYLANTDRHDLTLQLWTEEIAGAVPD